MRLRTKLILTCSVATAIISVGAGAVAVIATSAGELSQIDSNLNVLAQTSQNSGDPVGSALLKLDSLGPDTEIGFYSINKDFTALSDAAWVVRSKPNSKQLKLAAKQPITVNQANGDSYRLRTAAMPDSEFVVFATSLNTSSRNTANNTMILGLVTSVAVVLGAVMIWLFTRRDLKRIELLMGRVKEIAEGNFSVEIERSAGRSELDTLNNSLVSMVDSLKGALANERLNQQKMKDFIADASHELKTPLTLIRGYSELLFKNQELDSEVIERSRVRIEDQIQRMQSLIADLLLLAELDQAKTLHMARVNFSEVVQSAVDDLKTFHAARKISVTISQGVFVYGSEQLLGQLMSNLISNLSRYVPDDCAVKLSLLEVEGLARLQVDDSGPGLPDAIYKTGIQQFNRFDQSRSRKYGGSGLGLSIMAAIVANHSGNFILSKSKLGGLCTVIELKIVKKNS